MTAYEEHLVNNGWSPEEAAIMYQRFSDPTFGRDPELMREYQPGFLSIPRSAQIGEARPVTLAPTYTQKLMQTSSVPTRIIPATSSVTPTPIPAPMGRRSQGTRKNGIPKRIKVNQSAPSVISQPNLYAGYLTQDPEGGLYGEGAYSPTPSSPVLTVRPRTVLPTESNLRRDPWALAEAMIAADTPSETPKVSEPAQKTETPTQVPTQIEDENIAIPDYELPTQTELSTKTEPTPQAISIKPPTVDLSWTDVNNRYGTDIGSWNEAAQELDRGNISLDDFAIDIHNPDQTTYSLPEATFGDLVDTAGHYLGSGLNLLGSGNLARDVAMGIPIKGTQLAKALGRDQLVPWLGRMSRPTAKIVKSEKALVDKIIRETAAHPYTSVAQNAVRGIRSGDYSALRWGLKHNPKLGQAYNTGVKAIRNVEKTINQTKDKIQQAGTAAKKYVGDLSKRFDQWTKPVNAPKNKTLKQQALDKSRQALEKTSQQIEKAAQKLDDFLMF